MQSILTVTTAASSYDLTTIDRVKLELDITDKATDALLSDWVTEESANFADLTNRVLASEVVTETFRQNTSSAGWWDRQDNRSLILRRFPVSSIASVTEDTDAALDATLYGLDAATGELFRLDALGNRTRWTAAKTVVVYTGGYTLLSGLPPKIQSAVVTLVKNRWFARKRDPSLKVEDITGVARLEYWVGPVGDGLPPDVEEAIRLYGDRRV